MEDKYIMKTEYNGKDIDLVFDKEYRGWMQKLIKFIKKVGDEQNKYKMSYATRKLLDKEEFEFMGTSIQCASQFFYFLMKDEMSESVKNFPLDSLCKGISENNVNEYIENHKYMVYLIKDKSNDMLVGQIYDFYVGMWNLFESSINALTKRYEPAIRRNNTNLRFISIKKRVEYLFNYVRDYSRSRNDDQKVLNFAREFRNTIHYNGIYLKNDMDVVIKGHRFELKNGEGVFFECYQDIMIIINEIFDIYCEIMRCVVSDIISEE